MCIVNALDLLASPVVHERVTRVRGHRPWPLPERSWTMAQTWTDLLFAHWAVAPESLRRVLPQQLPLDTFDGQAWIGVTPFGVRNLRLRPAPPVPCLSAFPEINVRTYVTVGGKPGIYFFSLDAGSSLAVTAARRAYRLPYFRAQMSIVRDEDHIRFMSRRTGQDAPSPAEFRGRYRPVGDTFTPPSGSLDHWLTERYCLYTFDERRRILTSPGGLIDACRSTEIVITWASKRRSSSSSSSVRSGATAIVSARCTSCLVALAAFGRARSPTVDVPAADTRLNAHVCRALIALRDRPQPKA